MSAISLKGGDRVYFLQNGRKLRGVVVHDTLCLRSRGEEEEIGVIRLFKSKKARCFGDLPDHYRRQPRVRWIPRSEVRKLPGKKVVTEVKIDER